MDSALVWSMTIGEDINQVLDGVWVIWTDILEDPPIEAVEIHSADRSSELIMRLYEPEWSLLEGGLGIDGYTSRPGITPTTITIHPLGTRLGVDPVEWSVEITTVDSGNLIAKCDPTTAEEVWDEDTFRLRLFHGKIPRFLEGDSLALHRLDRFRLVFRGLTKHRGELCEVDASFRVSPIYSARQELGVLKENRLRYARHGRTTSVTWQGKYSALGYISWALSTLEQHLLRSARRDRPSLAEHQPAVRNSCNRNPPNVQIRKPDSTQPGQGFRLDTSVQCC